MIIPDIGAYPGHGTLGPAGSSGSGGTFQNAQLVRYSGHDAG